MKLHVDQNIFACFRMLRSDTFNPAIRVKNAPEQEAPDEEGKEGTKKKEEKKLTPAEYRRIHG